jgi:hypothetical protein
LNAFSNISFNVAPCFEAWSAVCQPIEILIVSPALFAPDSTNSFAAAVKCCCAKVKLKPYSSEPFSLTEATAFL